MAHWDGLRTAEHSRVLVLAATNRPFDLDEAVIRRLPRRLMVDLPDATNRERILRVILAKEELEGGVDGFPYDQVAAATDGCVGRTRGVRGITWRDGTGRDVWRVCFAGAR